MNTVKPTDLPQLYNSRQVADCLQISVERLYTLVNTAEFPVIRMSRRRLRYDVDEIKEWLRERGWRGVT